jgi:hypothetical protein
MAAPVQTIYSARMAPGVPGMIATERQRDVSSRLVENSNGIPFGRACGQGVAWNGVKLGGTLLEFVGVSLKDPTLVLPATMDSDYADIYTQGLNVGVLTMGDVWVMTGGAVVVGGAVFFNATTGIFDDGGGNGPIPGARWETPTSGAAVAILHLSGIQRT